MCRPPEAWPCGVQSLACGGTRAGSTTNAPGHVVEFSLRAGAPVSASDLEALHLLNLPLIYHINSAMGDLKPSFFA